MQPESLHGCNKCLILIGEHVQIRLTSKRPLTGVTFSGCEGQTSFETLSQPPSRASRRTTMSTPRVGMLFGADLSNSSSPLFMPLLVVSSSTACSRTLACCKRLPV